MAAPAAAPAPPARLGRPSMPGLPLWRFVALARFKKARSLARRAVVRATGRREDRFAEALPRAIPRRIWLYWDTGEASAPPVVTACIASWRRLNPGWEVVVLDAAALAARGDVPPKPPEMTVQAHSDLVRLRLLRRHGGVWADATVMCLVPLDHWLPPVAASGFFAFLWTEADAWFVRPNIHRVLTSWFLASEAEGAVVGPWEAASVAYWQGRRAPHDYYWVHLILETLSRSDAGVARAFRAMPALGAYRAHLVHDYVHAARHGGRDRDAVAAALASGAVPVQKLRWTWSEAERARAAEVLPALADAAPGPQPAASAGPAAAPRAAAGG